MKEQNNFEKNIDLVVCTGFRIHAVKRKHGGKRMNIKEVEKVTGISSQNIRFYEKADWYIRSVMKRMDIVSMIQMISEY